MATLLREGAQWCMWWFFAVEIILRRLSDDRVNLKFIKSLTIVWEKFDVENFSLLVGHDENQTHEKFLTMNKKVTVILLI